MAFFGAIVGALGSVVQGMNASAMSSYQANVARANAQIMEQNRVAALKKGQIDTQIAGMKYAAQAGSIAAHQGASGIDMGSGSSTEVRAGAAEMANLGQENVNTDAKYKAYNFDVQKAQYNNQAGLYDAKANSDMVSGFFGAMSSIVGGASNFADKWDQFKIAGIDPVGGGLY